MKLLISSFILILAVSISLLLQKKPLFDDELLHQITNNAVQANMSLEETFANITAELKFHYGPHITTSEEWQFNCAGGFKSAMKILHISITEYIMFWGSSVSATGMSGRHFGEFHDFIISGEFTQWKEGTVETKTYGPMGRVHHGRYKGSVVSLKPGTWMLEHFVGFLPTSLPFGNTQ